MKITIANELKRVPNFWYKHALARIAHSYEPYHPVVIGGSQLSAGQRACIDRWPILDKALKESGVRTIVDLGCAEGYFVTQAARAGYVALGVDADVRRLSLAQAMATLDRIPGAGFMFSELTFEFIDALPPFDAVLLLSVLHHVMYEKGVDYAREYMKCVRRKAQKAVIFDMGQSNEVANAWAKELPDMGAEPHLWIADFLRSAGFTGVEKMRDTDAYKSGVKRALFKLTP